MNKIKIILFLLIASFGKTLLPQTYTSAPQKIPDNYIVNTQAELDSFISINLKNNDPELFRDFAEQSVYQKKAMLLNGNVYYNFNDYEAYLNNILKRLIDSSYFETKIAFRAYLKNDESYNAFALPDGTVLVTIGLMANCKNEDALACILAHEIAHVKYHDAYKEYKKNMDIDWRNLTEKEFNKIISSLNYSRTAEMRADSFGFYLAMNAGFDIKQGYSNHDYVYRQEVQNEMYVNAREKSKDKKQRRYIPLSEQVINAKIDKDDEDDEEDDIPAKESGSKSGDKSLRTHPETIDRILLLKRIIDEDYRTYYNFTKKTNTDITLFPALQKIAKNESLRIMLQEHKYADCMEAAFIYHLMDTLEQVPIYYELEAIRRYLTVDSSQLRNGFLNFDLKKRLKRSLSILHLPLYLIPDSNVLMSLEGTHYFDSVYEFESYKDAFKYFSKKANAAANIEINLTTGLFHKTFEIQKGDSLLKNYISHDKSYYKEYAQAFLDRTLYSGLEKNTRNIILCSDIKVFIGTKTKFKQEYISSDSVTSKFIKDFNSFQTNKELGTEVCFLRNQSTGDFNILHSYATVLRSVYFVMNTPIKKESEIEEEEEDTVFVKTPKKKLEPGSWYASYLYSLEPETWSFIKLNNIRNIGGFYSTKLYDRKMIQKDILTISAKIIVPGLILSQGRKGSRVNMNMFLFINFKTSKTDEAILYDYEESKDKFSRRDYINTFYFKMYKNKIS